MCFVLNYCLLWQTECKFCSFIHSAHIFISVGHQVALLVFYRRFWGRLPGFSRVSNNDKFVEISVINDSRSALHNWHTLSLDWGLCYKSSYWVLLKPYLIFSPWSVNWGHDLNIFIPVVAHLDCEFCDQMINFFSTAQHDYMVIVQKSAHISHCESTADFTDCQQTSVHIFTCWLL